MKLLACLWLFHQRPHEAFSVLTCEQIANIQRVTGKYPVWSQLLLPCWVSLSEGAEEVITRFFSPPTVSKPSRALTHTQKSPAWTASDRKCSRTHAVMNSFCSLVLPLHDEVQGRSKLTVSWQVRFHIREFNKLLPTRVQRQSYSFTLQVFSELLLLEHPQGCNDKQKHKSEVVCEYFQHILLNI